MRLLRFLVACSTFLASWHVSLSARAATVTLGNPVWSNRPETELLLDQINRADCLADGATIQFSVSIAGASPDNLFQVWSGSSCETKTNRDRNLNCVMVYNGSATTMPISVSVKDILQPVAQEELGVGTGSEATCTQEGGSSGITQRTLYFMVLNQSALDMAPLGQASWPFDYDLTPPGAPTLDDVGPGEESLTLDFSAPEGATDLKGYRFYCAPDEGGCSSTVLVPGEDPPSANACGSASSKTASSGTTDSQPNGVSVAVAVAAEDSRGNVGVLSELGCAVPQEVTGFFEAYRAAGGQAGGGFCGFSPAGRAGLPIALVSLLAAAAWLGRRR